MVYRLTRIEIDPVKETPYKKVLSTFKNRKLLPAIICTLEITLAFAWFPWKHGF